MSEIIQLEIFRYHTCGAFEKEINQNRFIELKTINIELVTEMEVNKKDYVEKGAQYRGLRNINS